ncbi:MAG: DHH family phosphoesterase [Clostridiales Family XIII bacterium]|nr:DHH family phosphoesterase [Clostridiales Family XIII bacterium]
MGEKILKKIAFPYSIAAIFILWAAFVFIRLGFDVILTVGIATALYIVFAVVVFFYHKTGVVEYIASAQEEIEDTLRYSIENHPFPLCLVNGDGLIAMTNEKFKEIFPDAKILTTTIWELIGEENRRKVLGDDEAAELTLAIDGRDFRILTAYVNKDKSKSSMYYFVDETEFVELGQKYDEEKLCYCYLNVDNYDDLLNASPDERKSIVAASIEVLVRQFAGVIDGSLLRISRSQYQIIFSKKYYQELADENFQILDLVRKLDTDADFPASFSIGIGIGAEAPSEAEEYAAYALDLARGRGGDQAVVKSSGNVTYFGGKNQIIENRNKGKSRVMSHAIMQMIKASTNVIIMGHKTADMDSFGSAIAMSHMAKCHNKPAYIVLDDFNHSLTESYNLAVETGYYDFIYSEDAYRLVNRETLLIILDTHVPEMVADPSLIGKVDKKILIDHHRKREGAIVGTTLSYMEPNASSTSELVVEILQFDDDIKKLSKFEAEMLLGGIIIDTNGFSVKTGARTFEAASWLRMNGADTTAVRQLLQSDMEDFKQRASIISNAEFTKNGIAISTDEGVHDNAPIIIAQAADELLDIKGIRASFVVGETSKEVCISARSLGHINVQLIMEKFGGGGHLTMAAAQVTDESADEVLKKLMNELNNLEGEKE